MNEHDILKSIVREHLADRETILKNAKQPPEKQEVRRPSRALAAVAAALVVLAVTAAAIPSARAAMLRLFTGEAFRTADYLVQEPESRAASPVPAIENLTVPAGAGENTVLYVNPDYADAFADFSMTVEEALYDGVSVFVTGSIGGSGARYVFAEYGLGRSLRVQQNEQCAKSQEPDKYDPSEPHWMLPETFLRGTAGAADAPVSVSFEPSWEDVEQKAMGWQAGDRPEEDPTVYERYEAHAADYFAGGGRIRYVAEIQNLRGEGGLSALADADGTLPLTLTLTTEYCDCGGEGASPGKLLVLELGRLRVRLDESKIEDQSRSFTAETTLSGTATVTHWSHDYETRTTSRVNEEIPLDGITVGVQELWLLPTTSDAVFTFDLPDAWTKAQADEFLRNGLAFDLIINGASLMQHENAAYWSGMQVAYTDEAGLAGTVTYEGLGLDPNGYGEIASVEVIPMIVCAMDRTDGGEPDYVIVNQRLPENKLTLSLR